jgi:hypothetical protein
MNSDAESRVPAPEQPDLWRLPEITSAEARLARYRPPRRHVVAGRVIEQSEGIEVHVRTDGEIPVRALSPALYIGDTVILESEQLDPNLYRFFVITETPQPEAPIRLGWVGHSPPPGDTRFRYQPPAEHEETDR